MMLPLPPQALTWADRLYAPLLVESTLSPMEDTARALEAYRAVLRRHPDSEGARRGFSRALFRLGRYEASAASYRQLKDSGSEGVTADRYADVVGRLANRLPAKRFVEHLFSLSNGRWATLTSHREITHRGIIESLHVDLRVFRETRKGLVFEGRPQLLSDGDDGMLETSFFRSAPTPGWVTVQTRRIGGDWAPNEVRLYRVHPDGLKLVKEFWSAGRTLVRAHRGAPLVAVTPTRRIWWTDVYAWSRGTYRLANVEHRNLYTRGDRMRPFAGTLEETLTDAAIVTMGKNRERAIRSWQKAAQVARGAYPDVTYGDPREVVRQIERRIGWLRKGEWNHWRLYRPYERDLQSEPNP